MSGSEFLYAAGCLIMGWLVGLCMRRVDEKTLRGEGFRNGMDLGRVQGRREMEGELRAEMNAAVRRAERKGEQGRKGGAA